VFDSNLHPESTASPRVGAKRRAVAVPLASGRYRASSPRAHGQRRVPVV